MITSLNPTVLRWARKRAGLDHATLAKKVFGKKKADPDQVKEWERTGKLDFRFAELLAQKTYTPLGYLFLDAPPAVQLPIKDFRTMGSGDVQAPSPNLLDVIYECQKRQAWFRDYLIESGATRLDFIGSASIHDAPEITARTIEKRLQIGAALSTEVQSWRENLALHFEAAESAGILVMRNSIVSNNPHRKLSVKEFRGFALADEYAPLVFINSRDAKAAQLFTLVHEIAHLWIGESAVSNPLRMYADGVTAERYCNEVAAEVLIPLSEFRREWNSAATTETEYRRIAREYKVSSLVALRRALDAGFISNEEFRDYYDHEVEQFKARAKKKETGDDGGNFYNSLKARSSDRFCRALIASTLEGRTPYREAFGLLGLKNTKSFSNFARERFGYLTNEVPAR